MLGQDRDSLTLWLSPAETTTGNMREISRQRGIQSRPSLPAPASTQESPVQELSRVGLVWNHLHLPVVGLSSPWLCPTSTLC